MYLEQKPLYYHNANTSHLENGFGCMDNKEKFSFIFIMKQRDAGPASQKVKAFFRSDDNSPSTGHFTRKALLCVFAQNDKIRLRFYSSTHTPICKEEVISSGE